MYICINNKKCYERIPDILFFAHAYGDHSWVISCFYTGSWFFQHYNVSFVSCGVVVASKEHW